MGADLHTRATDRTGDGGGAHASDQPGPRRRPRLSTVGMVALAALFALALRAPFVTQPLAPDEAGLLIIADTWSEGPYLYGDHFVGRGIVVLLFYKLADLLGGALALRLLACLVVVALVVGASRAGYLLRGRSGAGWAALVTAAYSSSYFFSSLSMNERLLASTFVMWSVALLLDAARRRSFTLAVGAGVLATLPVLVVQSFVDALAFAGVFLLASLATRTLRWGEALRLVAGGLTGMLLTAAALALGIWATWLTWSQWWFQMVGFRMQTSEFIGVSTDRPEERLRVLLVMATVTGAFLIVAGFLLAVRRIWADRGLRPVWPAVLVMFGVAIVGWIGGGDYWTDYLQQPIPALALSVALVAPTRSLPGLSLRVAAVVAAVSSVVSIGFAAERPFLGSPKNERAVGTWLKESGDPGDTAVVIWGKANVLHASGMDSPYPHLWSLIMRTLDRDLMTMVNVLEGPEAPTWVVVWHDTNSWDLDVDGRLGETLEANYELVATPCDREVWLRRGESRDVLPSEACGS